MTSFIPRKLESGESLGQKLQQARLFKNLKIELVGKSLGIQPRYLSALEEENFEVLPAGLYGRNYLKKYAEFLKLNTIELLGIWDKIMATENMDDPFSQKVVRKNKFIVFPKIVKNVLISLAILACFLYLVFYFKKIIFAPSLEIIQPTKNLSINSNSITIIGHTDKEAEVKINGEVVLNNTKGNFSQTINLKEGLNNIVIKAKKKYSRERTVTKQILVEEK